MTRPIILVSHALCPFVQRIAIALAEKGVKHDRITVDLANKPDWFLKISPLGRTPVLKVGEAALFESAAILEYLEETQPNPLHPADPVERARHRAWIGFGSECLNDIAGFYSAADTGMLEIKAAALRARFGLIDRHLGAGPWFAGDHFSLVEPSSRRCSAISTPSTGSANSAYSTDSLACRTGARHSLGARRCAPPWDRTIMTGFTPFSTVAAAPCHKRSSAPTGWQKLRHEIGSQSIHPAQSLLGMKAMPCDNHVRAMLDHAPGSILESRFKTIIEDLDRRGGRGQSPIRVQAIHPQVHDQIRLFPGTERPDRRQRQAGMA